MMSVPAGLNNVPDLMKGRSHGSSAQRLASRRHATSKSGPARFHLL